jgi:transposase
VLAAVDRGARVYEVAPLFEVGVATALPKCGRSDRKLDHHLDALAAHVAAYPDAILAELVECAAKRGVKVCVATMWATLEALGIRLKKRAATPRSGSARMLRLPGKCGAQPRLS